MLTDRHDSPRIGLRKFLHILGSDISDDAMRERIVIPTYQKLIPTYARSWRLSEDDIRSTIRQHTFNTQPSLDATPATELIGTLDQCMPLALEKEAQALLTVGMPDVSRVATTHYSSWLLVDVETAF